MPAPYKVQPYDLGGVTIVGWRRDDGKIEIGLNRQTVLDAFPNQVEVEGVVYNLEQDLRVLQRAGRAGCRQHDQDAQRPCVHRLPGLR